MNTTLVELTRRGRANHSGHPDDEDHGSISRRRINVSSLEQLQTEMSFQNLISWRSKWNDLYILEHLSEYPSTEQVAALRLVLSTGMLQLTEMVLNVRPSGTLTPDTVLEKIQQYLLKQRSVAFDRVEFHECNQVAGQSFDLYYIRLKRIAVCAELGSTCWDTIQRYPRSKLQRCASGECTF
ncbi:hypothetical protein GHT06_018420 [Daphnia sinensis]|uniref:Uncharacterized protein n=1 Tax=Daphnia sinensis TaxID=1820382 RepID=A0AAD5PT48_9CRUS|nr:hypothetical protein GHT06_018420 [Daphnia sinensis]